MPISRRLGRGEPEGRVVAGGQAEADAGFLHAPHDSLRRQLDGDAQGLQHVGGAALRAGRPRPVLAHRHAGAGGDDGSHRADVDAVAAVATRADDVDRAGLQFADSGTSVAASSTASSRPEISSGVSPFARSATTNPMSCAGRRIAVEDRGHRSTGVGGRQVAPVEQFGEDRGPAAQFVDSTHRADEVLVSEVRLCGAPLAVGVIRRRSRSLVAPPQTPAFSRTCSAYSKQATRTPQSAHTAFASSASSSSSGIEDAGLQAPACP
jgi:hypothetical protein